MPYQQVTLADCRTRLAERWASTPFWTTADADQAINAALRAWNLLTAQWKVRLLYDITYARVQFINQSSGFYPLRIVDTYNNSPISPTTLYDLDYQTVNWEGTFYSTTPVAEAVKYWAPFGIDGFILHKQPNAFPGTSRQVAIDLIQDTPVLVNSTDYINIGQEELSAILGEALHTASFKEGGERFSNTMKLHNEFIKAALDKNARLLSSTFFRKYEGLDTDRQDRPSRAQLNMLNKQEEQ